MPPKRISRKRRQVNVRANIDALSAGLHLREQQRMSSPINPLDRPPHYTTEQLALMNLQPDARHPGRALASMSQNNDSQLPSRTWREIHADINSRPRIEGLAGPTISAALLEQDRRGNSTGSRFRGELDSCRHQALLFTFIDDKTQSESQDKIMASDLAARLTTEDSTELTNLRNARDLTAATQSAERLIRLNRAASKRKSYDQKIQRWKQWCAERHFEDHDTVTENKLFFYLNSEVIPKDVQTQGKRKGAVLSEEDLDGYIKPIVALYKVSP